VKEKPSTAVTKELTTRVQYPGKTASFPVIFCSKLTIHNFQTSNTEWQITSDISNV